MNLPTKFFVPCGTPNEAKRVCEALRKAGYETYIDRFFDERPKGDYPLHLGYDSKWDYDWASSRHPNWFRDHGYQKVQPREICSGKGLSRSRFLLLATASLEDGSGQLRSLLAD